MTQRNTAITAGRKSPNAKVFGLLPLLVAAFLVTTPSAWADDIKSTFKRHIANSTQTVDHSAWDGLLKRYVVPADDGINYVDYKRFKAEAANDLKAYVSSLEAVDVTRLNRNEQYAFWANLYNAKTIDIILDHYPVKSIKDVRLTLWRPFDGPWVADVTKVNGIDLSLNDIEHTIMRGLWKEPRVHYAVNCASIGCPNLATKALTGANLEAMLDAGARAYVNSPRGIRVENGKVIASKIYSWFIEDFGDTEKGVLKHARAHAEGDLAKALTRATSISDHEYDWNLNDVKKDARQSQSKS